METKKEPAGSDASVYRVYKRRPDGAQHRCDAVERFCPSPWKGLFAAGEEKHWKTFLSRLYFWAITGGRLEIYFIRGASGAVVHTSFAVPRCGKFPFLQEGDFEIGPCQTAPEARGQGLYVATLRHITAEKSGGNGWLYMLVREDNTPSVRGIERAGFEKAGWARRKGLLKQYVMENGGHRP